MKKLILTIVMFLFCIAFASASTSDLADFLFCGNMTSATEVIDVAGNTDLTANGSGLSVAINCTSGTGNCIQFSGAGHFTNNVTAVVPAGDFTIDFWFNYSIIPGTGPALLGIGKIDEVNGLIKFLLDKNTKKLSIIYAGTDWATNVVFAENDMTHLIYKWDATAQNETLYVNGRKNITRNRGVALALGSDGFNIGSGLEGPTDAPLNGTIDEFAVYNFSYIDDGCAVGEVCDHESDVGRSYAFGAGLACDARAYDIYLTPCNNENKTATLNITFRDEIGNGLLTNSKLDGLFSLRRPATTTIYRNFTINETGSSSYQFCIVPSTASIETEGTMVYTKDGYVTRTYYYFNKSLTNVTTYDTFYHLSTANSTSVTLTTTDENDKTLTGYYVDLLHWYPDENLYRNVEISKTDSDGQVLKHVIYNTVFYKLRFRDGNTILRETDKFQIHNTALNYQLVLEPSYLDQYVSLRGINSALTFNNVTGIFSFSWTDAGTSANEYCLKVEKITGVGNREEVDQCSSLRSGIIEHTLTSYDGRYIAISYTKQAGSREYSFMLDLLDASSDTNYLTFGATGLFMAGMFLMMMAFVGLVMMGIAGIPLFIMIGLGAFGLMGIIALQITTYIGLVVLVGIMLWKIRK